MSAANADQAAFWGGDAGDIWVRQMAQLDGTFAPVLAAVLARAALQPGEDVLDVGCGAGTSTFAAAQAVGPEGRACGLDISPPLVAAARAQAGPRVSFQLGDAQTCDWQGARFDCLISRFGVMFFDDSACAFRNMARALRPGGRMVFASWGAIGANPFFTFPAGIAKAALGQTPKSDPDGPGPFAFRDPARVVQILSDAGFAPPQVEVLQMELTPPGSARDVAAQMCLVGPAHSALVHFEADAAARDDLMARLIAGLADFQTPQGLRIPAEINFFTARLP